MINTIKAGAALLSLCLLGACSKGAWNNPHPPETGDENVYYSVIFAAPPKHLDPALSYASDESLFLSQIYQPPLAYHFLKRPYELIPLALEAMPEIEGVLPRVKERLGQAEAEYGINTTKLWVFANATR